MDTKNNMLKALKDGPHEIMRPLSEEEICVSCNILPDNWGKDVESLLQYLLQLPSRGRIRCLGATRLRQLNKHSAKELLKLLPSLEIVDLMRCESLSPSAFELLLQVPSLKVLSLGNTGNLKELITFVCKSENLSMLFLRRVVWLDGMELLSGDWKSQFMCADKELLVHCERNHRQARVMFLDVYFPRR